MAEWIDATFALYERCGIYVLYEDRTCLYVGQSKQLIRRVRQHRSLGVILFNRVEIKLCEPEELDTLEFHTIRELQPKLNQTLSGPTLTEKRVDLVKLGLVRRQ